jgi:hypothetical protein
VLVPPHDSLGILHGILQALRLHFLASSSANKRLVLKSGLLRDTKTE